MGTIKQGILGGFSGKVGTVIGSSWKGISYMRGQAQHVKNPRSAGQLNQRSKFSLALSFLQPVVPYIRIGYKSQAAKQTEFNAAMSYTIKNAITGSYPSYALDFTKIVVSKGGLTQVTGATASWNNNSNEVKIDWTDNSGVGNALATDKAMPFIYNKAKGETIYDTAGATRATHTQSLTVPNDWEGDKVEVYLGMVSDDGKEVADSIYLGEVTLTPA
jgi:hypothetical protein